MYLDRLLLSSCPGQLLMVPRMSSVMTHEVSQGDAEHHAGQRELREIFLRERNNYLTGVMITVRGSLSVAGLPTLNVTMMNDKYQLAELGGNCELYSLVPCTL